MSAAIANLHAPLRQPIDAPKMRYCFLGQKMAETLDIKLIHAFCASPRCVDVLPRKDLGRSNNQILGVLMLSSMECVDSSLETLAL